MCLSFIFYAWGEPYFVFLLYTFAYFNYALAIRINNSTKNKKLLLLFGLVIDFALLFIFKYGTWFFNIISSILLSLGILNNEIPFPDLKLPLGISFFTFQAVSYLIDVYKMDVAPAKTYVDFSCYLTMFSQLVAGPIVRYTDVARDIYRRNINIDDIYSGIQRFVIGLAKKVLIANQVAIIADTIFSFLNMRALSPSLTWLGAIAYSMQIYYDFSAYSDMAIGIGQMLGFKFMENFRHPYAALSIKDFWRRWHISLSSWFRDYVYIPLGGNKSSNLTTYRNQMLVFLLCGLWHGANFTFILWGAWHGIFLIIEKIFNKKRLPFPKIIRTLYVWCVFCIGWVFFRSDTLTQATVYIKTMFGLTSPAYYISFVDLFDKRIIATLVIAIIGSFGFITNYLKRIKSVVYLKGGLLITVFELFSFCFGILLILCSTALLLNGSYNPFIYFRF